MSHRNPVLPQRRSRAAPALLVVGVTLAGAAIAAEPIDHRSDARAFLRCGPITVAEDRLACYDAAYRRALADEPAVADAIDGSQPAGGPAAPAKDSAPAAAAADADFGRREPARARAESIRSRLLRTARTPEGRLLFYLDNGQVWQQVESKRLRLPGEAPVVEIHRAALGSYKLGFPGHSGWTRVKRLR